MTRKMPKPALLVLLGSFMFLAFAACNNKGGDKKETPADTAAPKPAEKMAPQPMDTMHMDSAHTRPVKTPD